MIRSRGPAARFAVAAQAIAVPGVPNLPRPAVSAMLVLYGRDPEFLQRRCVPSIAENSLVTEMLSTSAAEMIDTRVVVETPEGVDFRFVIAGPGKRSIAFAADLALKLTITIAAAAILSTFSVFGEIGQGLAAGLFLLMLFIVNWFYAGLFEAFWNGRTPGKSMCSLRVVRTNGTPVSPMNALGRNLLAAADCMPPLGLIPTWSVGILTMFSNRRMQRLGDLVFDTMVVDESREWVSRAPGITADVEAIPRTECSGRFSVPERTLAIIERLFEGDRIISDGRREEIARPVSEALRARLGWEEPGPDPSNPHVYFTQVPNRHTTFLRRVLKTFADDPRTKEENSRMLSSATQQRIRPQRVMSESAAAVRSEPRQFLGSEGTLDALQIDWSVPGGSDSAATDASSASAPSKGEGPLQ